MKDYYEEVADMMLASVSCRHVPRDVLLRKLREKPEAELRAMMAKFTEEAKRMLDANPGIVGLAWDAEELEEAYRKQRAMK